MPPAFKLSLIAFIVVSAFLASPAEADEQPAMLTLEEAVTRAISVNPDILRAMESLAASEADLRVAGIDSGVSMGADGSLETGAGIGGSGSLFGRWEYNGLNGMQSQVEVKPLAAGGSSSGVSLTVKKPLTRGKGALSVRADAMADAVSSLIIREDQLFMARQAAVSGVIDAYFSAVLATEEIKVQERALIIAQEAADGARKRAEAGLVAEIEVSRAEIRVARTKDELL